MVERDIPDSTLLTVTGQVPATVKPYPLRAFFITNWNFNITRNVLNNHIKLAIQSSSRFAYCLRNDCLRSLKKDIDKLERVQRRATKLIPELRILSYEDRVQQCKLTTLETRRVRGDQIEVFKITHRIEGLDSGMFFKYRTDNRTRGHSWALAKERCKLDIRKYAFSQWTINEWNRLAGECVNATSVNMFKNKIDNYFKRSGYV